MDTKAIVPRLYARTDPGSGHRSVAILWNEHDTHRVIEIPAELVPLVTSPELTREQWKLLEKAGIATSTMIDGYRLVGPVRAVLDDIRALTASIDVPHVTMVPGPRGSVAYCVIGTDTPVLLGTNDIDGLRQIRARRSAGIHEGVIDTLMSLGLVEKTGGRFRLTRLGTAVSDACTITLANA